MRNVTTISLAIFFVLLVTFPVSAQVNPRHGIPDSILLNPSKCIAYADEILDGRVPLTEGASLHSVYIAKLASVAGLGRYQEADSLFKALVSDSSDVLHSRDFMSIAQARSGYLMSMGNLSEAELEGLKCAEYAEALNDTSALTMCLNNLGNAVLWQGREDESLKYYFRALDIIKDRSYSSTRALLYDNVAVVYSRIDSLSLALNYCKKGLAENLNLNRRPELGFSYGNLAYYRMASGFYDDSVKVLLSSAETIFLSDNLTHHLAWIYNLEGYYYGKSDDTLGAKESMLKALSVLNAESQPYEAARIYSSLAANYRKLNQSDSSFYFLERAQHYVEKSQDLDLHIQFTVIKAEVEREFGFYEDALNTYEGLVTLKDSLAAKNQSSRVNEISEKYKSEQLLRESLEKDLMLLEISTTKQRLIILSVILLLMIFIVLVTFQYRSRQSLKRANLLLISLNKREQRIEELERMDGITIERLNRELNGHESPISIAEFEVIQLIVEQDAEIKMAEIADRLNISYDTLKSRKRAITKKLGCESSSNRAIFDKIMEICQDE